RAARGGAGRGAHPGRRPRRRVRGAARENGRRAQAERQGQGRGDRRVHGRAAVQRAHAGLRRRRPDRRVRLCADQPHRRTLGEGGRRGIRRALEAAGFVGGEGLARGLRRARGGRCLSGLDLALIGNSSVAALIDARGRIVWSCLPRFDSDPAFCALLREDGTDGVFEVDLADFERSEQAYIAHTPILKTRLYDRHGGGVEITDFAPRFQQFGRLFCPVMLVRQIRPLAGSPRTRVRIRPLCEYGARRPAMPWGSNHVRYVMPDMELRLTTDFSVTAILEETLVVLREPVSLVLGPDETLHTAPGEASRRFLDDTAGWWRDWTRGLAISFQC